MGLINKSSETKTEGKKPEKKFRAGGIVATIWKNGEGDKTFFTVNIERNYKDKDGNWKNTNNVMVNDLPKVVLVCQEAYKALIGSEE